MNITAICKLQTFESFQCNKCENHNSYPGYKIYINVKTLCEYNRLPTNLDYHKIEIKDSNSWRSLCWSLEIILQVTRDVGTARICENSALPCAFCNDTPECTEITYHEKFCEISCGINQWICQKPWKCSSSGNIETWTRIAPVPPPSLVVPPDFERKYAE